MLICDACRKPMKTGEKGISAFYISLFARGDGHWDDDDEFDSTEVLDLCDDCRREAWEKIRAAWSGIRGEGGSHE